MVMEDLLNLEIILVLWKDSVAWRGMTEWAMVMVLLPLSFFLLLVPFSLLKVAKYNYLFCIIQVIFIFLFVFMIERQVLIW